MPSQLTQHHHNNKTTQSDPRETFALQPQGAGWAGGEAGLADPRIADDDDLEVGCLAADHWVTWVTGGDTSAPRGCSPKQHCGERGEGMLRVPADDL